VTLCSRSSRAGVTRTTVVVCLLMVIVVVAIALPFVLRVIDAQNRTQTVCRLKQLSIGVQDAASENEGAMPPSLGTYREKEGTFFYHMLPYIEQDAVWRQEDTGKPIMTFRTDLDPSHPKGKPWTSFASNSVVFGVNPDEPARIKLAFGQKGTSNTIIALTRYAVAGGKVHAWADTSEGATYLDGSSSEIEFGVSSEKARNDTAHAMSKDGGAMVGLGDGSSRAVSRNVSVETFRWACDPKAKMPPPSDW
jgi:hypothetical protein